MSMIAAIWRLFPQVGEVRAAWRAEGLSEAEIAANTERMVRHHLDPEVPDEAHWPPQWAYVRCPRCEGTGLVVHTEVNRLGLTVETGVPCVCTAGARFEVRTTGQEPDHREAGKTPKRKSFTRYGR